MLPVSKGKKVVELPIYKDRVVMEENNISAISTQKQIVELSSPTINAVVSPTTPMTTLEMTGSPKHTTQGSTLIDSSLSKTKSMVNSNWMLQQTDQKGFYGGTIPQNITFDEDEHSTNNNDSSMADETNNQINITDPSLSPLPPPPSPMPPPSLENQSITPLKVPQVQTVPEVDNESDESFQATLEDDDDNAHGGDKAMMIIPPSPPQQHTLATNSSLLMIGTSASSTGTLSPVKEELDGDDSILTSTQPPLNIATVTSTSNNKKSNHQIVEQVQHQQKHQQREEEVTTTNSPEFDLSFDVSQSYYDEQQQTYSGRDDNPNVKASAISTTTSHHRSNDLSYDGSQNYYEEPQGLEQQSLNTSHRDYNQSHNSSRTDYSESKYSSSSNNHNNFNEFYDQNNNSLLQASITINDSNSTQLSLPSLQPSEPDNDYYTAGASISFLNDTFNSIAQNLQHQHKHQHQQQKQQQLKQEPLCTPEHMEPLHTSPRTTLRQNSMHVALKESNVYIQKIRELQEALSDANAEIMELREEQQQKPRTGSQYNDVGQNQNTTTNLNDNDMVQQLQERNKTLEKEIKFADQTCLELSGRNTALQNELDTRTNQWEKLVQENHTLRQQLNTTSVTADTSAISTSTTAKTVKSVVERSLLQHKKDQAIHQLKERLHKLENKHKQAIEDGKHAQQQNQQLSEERDKLLTRNTELSTFCEQIKQSLQQSQTSLDQVSAERDHLDRMFKQTKQQLLQLSSETRKTLTNVGAADGSVQETSEIINTPSTLDLQSDSGSSTGFAHSKTEQLQQAIESQRECKRTEKDRIFKIEQQFLEARHSLSELSRQFDNIGTFCKTNKQIHVATASSAKTMPPPHATAEIFDTIIKFAQQQLHTLDGRVAAATKTSEAKLMQLSALVDHLRSSLSFEDETVVDRSAQSFTKNDSPIANSLQASVLDATFDNHTNSSDNDEKAFQLMEEAIEPNESSQVTVTANEEFRRDASDYKRSQSRSASRPFLDQSTLTIESHLTQQKQTSFSNAPSCEKTIEAGEKEVEKLYVCLETLQKFLTTEREMINSVMFKQNSALELLQNENSGLFKKEATMTADTSLKESPPPQIGASQVQLEVNKPGRDSDLIETQSQVEDSKEQDYPVHSQIQQKSSFGDDQEIKYVQLREKLDEAEQKIIRTETKFRAAVAWNERLSTERESFREKFVQVEQLFEQNKTEMESRLVKQQAELNQALEDCKHLRWQIADATRHRDTCVSEANRLHLDLIKSNNDSEAKSRHIALLENKLANFENTLSSRVEDASQHREELQEQREIVVWDNQSRTNEGWIEALCQDRDEFKEKLDQADKELEEKESMLHDALQECSKLRSEVAEFKLGKEKCVSEINDLQSKLKKSQQSLDELRIAHAACKNELAHATESIKKNQLQRADLQLESSLDEAIDELNAKEQIALLQADKENLELQLHQNSEEFARDRDELESKFQSAEQEILVLDDRSRNAEILVEQLSQELSSSREKLKNLEQELTKNKEGKNGLAENAFFQAREENSPLLTHFKAAQRTKVQLKQELFKEVEEVTANQEPTDFQGKSSLVEQNTEIGKQEIGEQTGTQNAFSEAHQECRMLHSLVLELTGSKAECMEKLGRLQVLLHQAEESLEQLKIAYVKCNEELAQAQESATKTNSLVVKLEASQNSEKNLRKDLARLIEGTNAKQEQIVSLEKDRSDLEVQLRDKHEELLQLRDQFEWKLRSAEEKIAVSEGKRNDLDATIARMSQELEQKKIEIGKHLTEKQNALSRARQECSLLRSHVSEVTESEKRHKAKSSHLEALLQKTEESLEKLKVSYVQHNEELAQGRENGAKVNSLLSQLEAAKNSEEKLREELVNSTAEMNAKQQKIVFLEQARSELEVELRDKVEEFERNRDEFNKTSKDLEQQIVVLNHGKRDQESSIEQLSQELEASKQRAKSLEKQFEEKNTECNKYMMEKNSLSQVHQECSVLRSQILEITESKEKYVATNSHLEVLLHQSEESLNKLKIAYVQCNDELAETKQYCEKNKSLLSQLEAAQSAEESLRAQLADSMEGVKGKEQQISILEQQTSNLEIKLQDKTEELEHLRLTLDQSKESYEQLKLSYVTCNEKLAGAVQSNESKEAHVEELKASEELVRKSLAEAEVELKTKSDLISGLEQEIERLEHLLKDRQEEMLRNQEDLKTKLDNAEKDLIVLEDKNSSASSRIKEMLEERDTMYEKLSNLELEMEKKKITMDKYMNEKQEELSQALQERNRLRSNISEISKEKEHCVQEVTRLELELQQSKKSLEAIKLSYVKCNEQLAEVVRREEGNEAIIGELRDACQAAEDIATHAEQQILEARNQLEKRQKKIDDLAEQLVQTQEELELSMLKFSEYKSYTEARDAAKEDFIGVLHKEKDNAALQVETKLSILARDLYSLRSGLVASLHATGSCADDSWITSENGSNDELENELTLLKHVVPKICESVSVDVGKIEAMNRDIERLEVERRKLVDSEKDLKNQLENEKVGASNLASQLHETIAKQEYLETQIAKLSNALDEARDEASSARNLVERVRAEKEEAQSLYGSTIKGVTEERDTAQVKLSQLEISVEALAKKFTKRVTQLLLSIENSANAEDALQRIGSDCLGDQHHGELQLVEVSEARESSQANCVQIEESVERLCNQLTESELKAVSWKARYMKAEESLKVNETGRQEIQLRCENRLRQFSEECETAKGKLLEIERSLEEKLAKSENEISQLQIALRTAEIKYREADHRFENSLRKVTEERDSTKSELLRMESSLKTLAEKLLISQNELSTTKECNIKTDFELRQQENNIRQLTAKNSSLQDKCSRLRDYIRKLTKKCEEWEESYGQQSNVLEKLHNQHNQTRQKASELSRMYMELRNDVQAKAKLHTEERATLTKELSNFQMVQVQLEEELNQISKEFGTSSWD